MKGLKSAFLLKPYGDHLCDGAAEIWLVFARINIAAVALCDAIAWAYLGYTTATGAVAWLAAALAGVIALTLVGSLDATFVMHDATQRSERPSVVDPAKSGGWLARLRRTVRRDHLAIGMRLLLVMLTFTVTAPFLTQLFFSRDIAAAIVKKNEQRISDKRLALTSNFDRRMDALRTQLNGRMQNLESEIAGSGRSGRYGNGPAADAIRRDIAQLEAALKTTEAAKTAEVTNFDAATPEALASTYGIDLEREGPNTRATVVAELELSPAFRSTRRTIKAFLLFMFFGLVSLKLFAGRSVVIYYRSDLQAAHARYRAGSFDDFISAKEQYANGGMSSVSFADWWDRKQSFIEKAVEAEQQIGYARKLTQAQEVGLAGITEPLSHDLTRMQQDYDRVMARKDEIEAELGATETQLGNLRLKIQQQEGELQRSSAISLDDVSPADRVGIAQSRRAWETQVMKDRTLAGELVGRIQKLTRQLEDNARQRQDIRNGMDAAGESAEKFREYVDRLRRQGAATIVSAG